MTSKKKLGRPKGQTKDTKQDILEAAFQVFANQGFAGTSISHIAKTASVNPSLIYHHFDNKLDLWRSVKAHIVHCFQPKYLNPSKVDTLQELITEYVDSRFEFYHQNPNVLRILLWQRLDNDQESLATETDTPKSPFYKALESFQQNGKLRSDMDLRLLINMIANMTIAPLMDCTEIFKTNPEKINTYKAMAVNVILKGITIYTQES